jgi:ketosteroid isomerase-like protein
MASANVDLVRSIFAAMQRGDFSSAAWADPQIEFEFPDGPAPGRWSGLEGLAEGWRGFLSAWEEYRVDSVEEYRELDDERVLALARHRGRGKSSGVELGQVSAKGAALFCIRGGKVTRLVLYFDRDRALTDLGLKE